MENHNTLATQDADLQHLLTHGAELDALGLGQAETEKFREQLEEILQGLEEVDDTKVAEAAREESPTGEVCIRCGMPATRYQLPAIEVVVGSRYGDVVLLCGVCSELSKMVAYKLANPKDTSYEEWAATLEGDKTKVGWLTPEAKKKIRAYRRMECGWDECRNEVEGIVGTHKTKATDMPGMWLGGYCSEHLEQGMAKATERWELQRKEARSDARSTSTLFGLLGALGASVPGVMVAAFVNEAAPGGVAFAVICAVQALGALISARAGWVGETEHVEEARPTLVPIGDGQSDDKA